MGSYKTRKNKHLGKHRRSKKHLKSKHAKRSKKTKRTKRTKRSKLSRKYKGGVGKMFNAAVASVTGTDKEGEKGALAAEHMEKDQMHPSTLTSGDLEHSNIMLDAVRNETKKKAEKRGMGPLKVTPVLRKAQSDLGPRASAHSQLAMGPHVAASTKKLEKKMEAEAKKHTNERIKGATERHAGQHASAAQIYASADGISDAWLGGKKRRR